MAEIPQGGDQLPSDVPPRDSNTIGVNTPGIALQDDNQDYPDIYGHTDSTGTAVKVNKKKGYIHIRHGPSGATLDINKDGRITITSYKKPTFG